MRFQDAAPDARAVVYAGIQADPLVARVAGLLADATLEQRILARAVMNGMSTDALVWRAMFPRLLGPDDPAGSAGPAGPERERSAAILADSLAVAERGGLVRQPGPGATGEEPVR